MTFIRSVCALALTLSLGLSSAFAREVSFYFGVGDDTCIEANGRESCGQRYPDIQKVILDVPEDGSITRKIFTHPVGPVPVRARIDLKWREFQQGKLLYFMSIWVQSGAQSWLPVSTVHFAQPEDLVHTHLFAERARHREGGKTYVISPSLFLGPSPKPWE